MFTSTFPDASPTRIPIKLRVEARGEDGLTLTCASRELSELADGWKLTLKVSEYGRKAALHFAEEVHGTAYKVTRVTVRAPGENAKLLAPDSGRYTLEPLGEGAEFQLEIEAEAPAEASKPRKRRVLGTIAVGNAGGGDP